MLLDIKQDCPINSFIKITFEDKIIQGLLVQIDDNKLKIKTETGVLILTAKILVNLMSYEVIEEKTTIQNEEKNEFIIQNVDNNNNIELINTIFSNGLSNFIKKVLEKKNYYGVSANKITKKEFTQSTLNNIRKLLEKVGGRHKERADYLLSEANLIQIIEPENEFQFRSVLSKYCNAMALASASDKPSDVVRHYYLEAFSLASKWDAVIMQVINYLFSYKTSGENLVILYNQKPSLQTAINEIFTETLNSKVWHGILDMFISNNVITVNVLSEIYKNAKARNSSIDFLNNYQIEIAKDTNQRVFAEKWNIAQEKRKGEFETWFSTINALSNTNDFNSLIAIIQSSLIQLKTNWLPDLDNSRLDLILKDIVYNSTDYLKQTSFDEKERLNGIINSTIERLTDDIEINPTRFSYEGFLPLLEHFQILLKSHFDNVLLTATPTVSLHILGEFVVIHNQLEIPVALRNEEKDKAPIYDIKLFVDNTTDVELIGKPSIIYEAIRGGDEKIAILTLKVSNQLVSQKIGDIKLNCTYKTRNQKSELNLKSDHTISLFDENEFNPIDNIFARYANSNTVTDKEMFYGRDELIKEIVEKLISAKSKNVVIYGQKRSGKSSVLYHLKQTLDSTNKAFCIDFSLSSLLTEWSITAFYYKILTEIDKELKRLQKKGIETPKFNKPVFEELEKNPTRFFREIMENFLEQFDNFEDWKDKRLTILIDEFTYIYSSIQRGTIPIDFMKTWRDIIDQSYFNSVLIGQDVMPDFMSKFANQFGVTEVKRLSYLKPEHAKTLIEKPIWYYEKNESRFIGNAVDKVLEYTAGNPYYIQIFGERLVNRMNDEKRKLIRVTEVTVKEVADTLTKGRDAFTDDKFDNLLTAGDADLEANPVSYTFEVIKQMALASRNIPSCSKQAIIDRIENVKIKERIEDILKDLDRRQVVSVNDGYYKIQVQLFKEWLLNR